MPTSRIERLLTFSPWLAVGLALLLLVFPLQWCFAIVLAVLFHELCHAIAVYLCGGQVFQLRLMPDGASMEAAPMSRGKELICALAGPAGGLLLLLFARWLPRTALCAGMHSLYNLLPIYPLDGGRALRCGAEMLLSTHAADVLCLMIEKAVLLAVLCLGIYGTFILRVGFMPLGAAIFLAWRTQNRKNLANRL